jgi:serine/threonine protein kinase
MLPVKKTHLQKHAPHDLLGGYRLASRVATSSTCEIWGAVCTRTDERFALKALQPSLRDDRLQSSQLKHEFTVGENLDHSAIIRTHHFGIDRGIAFLVLEFFPAPNMKLWCRQDEESNAQQIPRVIEQAAGSLDYFHTQGWIHRDVKPDNFLIDEQGDLKLIVFTLAQKTSRWWPRLLSGTGKIQGTRSYMPPEQIQRKPQDLRSDIYSFGCVLYELLAGKLPFVGDNSNDLLNKHLHAPVPSLRATNPRVNDTFDRLVARMMSKEPDERPSSMEEVLHTVRVKGVFDGKQRRPE